MCYKTFFAQNCYHIIVSESVCHCHSLPRKSNGIITTIAVKSRRKAPDLLTNIILVYKRMAVANTLAYYDTATITAVNVL
jgi:hypothetical protein